MLVAAVPAAEISSLLPIVITLAMATVVLASIAFDLRRLRRDAALKAVHGVIGAVSTAIVVGGSLVMCIALGGPTATAIPDEQSRWPAPAAVVSVDRAPVGGAPVNSTDIQLPTLSVE